MRKTGGIMLMKLKDGRIAYFDNLKFFLILTVVFGHAADYYTKSSAMMRYLYIFIYTFHMPLFILLSGYFMKSMIGQSTFKVDKICSYFILYLFMQITIYIMKIAVMKEADPVFHFMSESGPPWYLMAMMIWPGLMYLLKNINKKYVLLISAVLGILIGYDRSIRDYLCLSRVLVFFPFFALGYYITERDIAKILNSKLLKIFSLTFMSALFVLILIKGDFLYQFRGFLTARNPYEIIKVPFPLLGGFYRLFIYAVMAVMSIAVLYLIPNCEIPLITKMGRRTLQVYILHYFVLRIANGLGWVGLIERTFPAVWKWIYLLICAALTFLLSAKIFQYPFKKIMRIKFDRIYR